MPKLWLYLIKKFTLQFFFTLLGIIGFLIIIRFSAIAGFATSGTDFLLILNFIALLIPYVLPYAIPLSALNASLLISRRLSAEKQFTALRSGGLSFQTIFFPLILIFFTLSIANFFTTGTLAPLSKLYSKTLIYETTLNHPLFITQKACPIKIKALYSDVGLMSSKDTAHHLVLAFKNKKNHRLSLMLADKLSVKEGILKGKNIAIISSLNSSSPDLQDDLIIENEASMSTSTQIVDALVSKDTAIESLDYLDFFQLLKNRDLSSYHKSELFKRIHIAISPLSFGLLGLCFGLSVSRKSSNLSIFITTILITVFMVTLILSKSFRSSPWLCVTLFAGMQALLILSAYIKLKKTERGKV